MGEELSYWLVALCSAIFFAYPEERIHIMNLGATLPLLNTTEQSAASRTPPYAIVHLLHKQNHASKRSKKNVMGFLICSRVSRNGNILCANAFILQ
ncbi:hypothetical protein MTO96_043028 [Rhipicephalus appendiculatus]